MDLCFNPTSNVGEGKRHATVKNSSDSGRSRWILCDQGDGEIQMRVYRVPSTNEGQAEAFLTGVASLKIT